MLTGPQIKAARALARMTGEELARAAGISAPTVKRLEAVDGPAPSNSSTEAAIRRALSERGVIVLDENGEGPGVRLRKGSATA